MKSKLTILLAFVLLAGRTECTLGLLKLLKYKSMYRRSDPAPAPEPAGPLLIVNASPVTTNVGGGLNANGNAGGPNGGVLGGGPFGPGGPGDFGYGPVPGFSYATNGNVASGTGQNFGFGDFMFNQNTGSALPGHGFRFGN